MTQLPSTAIRACRSALDDLNVDPERAHAGLTLDRYFLAHKPTDKKQRQEMKEKPEETVLETVSGIQVNDTYHTVFGRWQNMLKQQFCETLSMELVSSLAVGLGNESPLEAGLRVHHTYGMPIIPGSAIKGMCLRGARILKDQGKLDEAQLRLLFGNTKSASCFVFWDAWYDPGSPEGKPFHRDVITVHHPDYYQKKKDAWPTDFDDPTPVPFLVVRPSARFLFAISAQNKEWGEYAKNLLVWCLQNLGVGGKTNAGYGYFQTSGSDKKKTSSFQAGSKNKERSHPPVFDEKVVKGKVVPAKVLSSEAGKVTVRLHITNPLDMTFTYQAGIQPDTWILVEVANVDKRGKPIHITFKQYL
ncbi:MAG: type III-B CRISPR module RAMP protein Cmr6 [Bacteroidetes bacterium]|nr:type III-B CRISPR module RAMP protein Cmr6 [Bacteroidota bacterium]MCW5897537.1 type III-B CRISPR module RAMP protein Cmr6 [Bacteroidota bacterium]